MEESEDELMKSEEEASSGSSILSDEDSNQQEEDVLGNESSANQITNPREDPREGCSVVLCPETLPQLTLVELPAQVRNPEKAYEMLGGLQLIADTARNTDLNAETMRFSMCQPYKFAAPIEGSRKKAAKVVFRVDKNGKAEVAGIVDKCYVFDSMADFQYLAPASLGYGGLATTKEYSVGQEMASLSAFPEILYCPPPYFTKKLNPDSYDFEDNAYAPLVTKRIRENGDNIEIRNKTRAPSNHVPSHIFRSTLKDVPMEPPEGTRPFEEQREKDILEQVCILFNKRPVWLRSSLEAHLDTKYQVLSWMFNRVLQHCAFLWQDGPYRQCYVRLGYDPREGPENMPFQVIDFRDPDLRVQKLKGNMISRPPMHTQTREARLQEVTFKIPPSQQSQLYQICDVQDSAIQDILKTATPRKEFDLHYGWVEKALFIKIRSQMKVKSAMMRSLGKNTSLALTAPNDSWAKN